MSGDEFLLHWLEAFPFSTNIPIMMLDLPFPVVLVRSDFSFDVMERLKFQENGKTENRYLHFSSTCAPSFYLALNGLGLRSIADQAQCFYGSRGLSLS